MTDKSAIFDHMLDTYAFLAAKSPFQLLTGISQGVISGMSSPLFNCVRLGQPEPGLLQDLKERHVPALFFATENFEKECSAFAQEQGLVAMDEVVASEFSIDPTWHYTPQEAFKVRLVSTEGDLDIFDDISSMAFQHEKGMAAEFLQPTLRDDEIQLFIISDNGVSAGCCMISFVNNKAGFYWGGVLPDHQHKGVGTEMTKYRLQCVKERGFEDVCVQNWRPSLSYFKKIGFTPVGTAVPYLLAQ